MSCKHDSFDVHAMVNRIEDIKRFHMDIRVKCADCGNPFRFIGLPMGLDFNSPTVEANGQEGRFPIYPAGEEVPGLPDDVLPGFRILNKEQP